MEEREGVESGHRRTSKIPIKAKSLSKVELSERKGSSKKVVQFLLIYFILNWLGSCRDPRTHTTVKSMKLSKTVGAKENMTPNVCRKALSSTDSILPRPKKLAAKRWGIGFGVGKGCSLELP